MSSSNKCKECGTAIPADSPGGFCAQCLLGLGLEQNQSTPDANDAPPDAGFGVPPSGGPGPAQAGIPSAIAAPSKKTGDRIGHYRLLQEIGHGGCGVVYMAEQEEPVRRKVALKVIKLGMDTRQVVARFEAERQALALMDHPNIAKILDAGITEGRARHSVRAEPESPESGAQGTDAPYLSPGRPYFVMELVGGIKITDYCDQNQLTTRQRLDLFIQVCRAIQHAHQKGIIHRDIKPSNILVAEQDGVAVPKVIDFGIAKATQGRLTDQTLFTAFEQFLGTPAYMSPEQAQLGSLDVDTRSDIYSLGVLLYELLTGTTPFDTKELVAAGLDEMRRTIREVEPVKPSTRLTSELVAAPRQSATDFTDENGGAPPRRRYGQIQDLIHSLRGDLDWIVMKCLEKDRARRYETANGLASDVQRHLNNEPVVARPPSKLYEFQKTVRRHKFGFAATAMVMAALAVGALVSTLQAVRATRAERKSAQFARFMKDMLSSVGPGAALGRDTTLLRGVLDNTAERIGKELTNQPELEADLRATLGKVYCDLADYTNAEAMQERALEIRKQFHGGEHPEVASSLNDLAEVRQWEGRLDEAEAMHRQALAMRRRLFGPSHADVAQSLSNLGRTLSIQGQYALTEAPSREAEPMLRDALAIQRETFGNESIEVARTLNWLSLVLPALNKAPEAEIAAREGLSICQKLYGNNHPALGNLSDALGAALELQGKIVEAETAYRQGMVARQQFLGGEHPELRFSFLHVGQMLQAQGRFPEAEAMFRELLKRPSRQQLVYGDLVEPGYSLVAHLLAFQGKPNEAVAMWHEAVERGQVHSANIMNYFAWFFATYPDAEIRNAPEALIYAEKAVAATGRTNAAYLDTLAACYAADGQFTNAVRIEREAIALLTAEKSERNGYASRLRLFDAGQPYLDAGMLATAGDYLLRQTNSAEAEKLLRDCLKLREKQTPDDWRTFNTKSTLGVALLAQRNYKDAEPLLLSGYEGLKERETTIPAAGKVRLKEALERLVQLYEVTDRPDQAAVWRQKLTEFDAPPQ